MSFKPSSDPMPADAPYLTEGELLAAALQRSPGVVFESHAYAAPGSARRAAEAARKAIPIPSSVALSVAPVPAGYVYYLRYDGPQVDPPARVAAALDAALADAADDPDDGCRRIASNRAGNCPVCHKTWGAGDRIAHSRVRGTLKWVHSLCANRAPSARVPAATPKIAKTDDDCSGCGKPIVAGESEIGKSPALGGWVHVECVEEGEKAAPSAPVQPPEPVEPVEPGAPFRPRGRDGSVGSNFMTVGLSSYPGEWVYQHHVPAHHLLTLEQWGPRGMITALEPRNDLGSHAWDVYLLVEDGQMVIREEAEVNGIRGWADAWHLGPMCDWPANQYWAAGRWKAVADSVPPPEVLNEKWSTRD